MYVMDVRAPGWYVVISVVCFVIIVVFMTRNFLFRFRVWAEDLSSDELL
jgi:membrane protein YdbS with pleckstrin-like domain